MKPLEAVTVVELASLAPAPFGCMMLADLGAHVTRVERPGSGALDVPTAALDRGKTTIVADLKTSDGLAAVRELSSGADVFVEAYRPGVAERLGVGPDDLLALNPRLVYVRMTGWGQHGPLAQTAGHDINYLALSGMLHPLARPGERPNPPTNVLADFAGGGMLLANGVLAALVARATTGRGQVLDVAMVDGASLYSTFLRGLHAVGLWSGEPGTNLLDGGAPFYDTYTCADGRHVAVGALEPQFFAALVDGLGLDATTMPAQTDVTGWSRWREVLTATFATKTRDEWAQLFDGTDACVTPVLTPWEAPHHPHAVGREAFVDVDGVMMPAPAPRFGGSDLGCRHPKTRDPAAPGTPVQRGLAWTGEVSLRSASTRPSSRRS